jgi:outer membrane autotransporter protein
LGGQASYSISQPWGVLVPQARLEWLHEFEDDSRLVTASFAQDTGAVEFSVPTDNPDRDYFNLGLGVAAVLPQGRSVFLYYETVVGRNDLTQHSVAAGVRLEF